MYTMPYETRLAGLYGGVYGEVRDIVGATRTPRDRWIEEGLQALVVPPSGEPTWAGPYLKKEVPKDPWSRPYLYQQPGTHGGDFDLLSYGKDGRAGGTGEVENVIAGLAARPISSEA